MGNAFLRLFCSSHIFFFILSVNEANQYRKQLRPMSRAEADVNNIYTINLALNFLGFRISLEVEECFPWIQGSAEFL